MKLKQWAKKQGITYKTSLSWFHAGQIPNAIQLETGTIIVDEPNYIASIDIEDSIINIITHLHINIPNIIQRLNEIGGEDAND